MIFDMNLGISAFPAGRFASHVSDLYSTITIAAK